MKSKQKNFYNHRTRSGQFYARRELINTQRQELFALAGFIAFALISSFFEAISSLLIK